MTNENFYNVALITKQTGNRKTCGICSVSRFALENSGSHGASSGILVIPQTCPSPRPSPCRLIVGTAMTALVCVCVCAAGTPSVCVFVYKMAPDRGEGGARVLLFSEAEIFDQLFPSEDNDESAPFHPPFCYFYGLFFSLSVICYYLPFMISFHLLNSFGCSLSVLKLVCMDSNKSFTWLKHFL